MTTTVLENKKVRLASALTALLTFLVYWPATRNGFVNWDDPSYVYENLAISSLSLETVKWAFTAFHAGNWHPLTWLSHALDVSFWGLDPMGHHLTSNVLHAANTFLFTLLLASLTTLAAFRKESERGLPVSLVAVFAGGLFFGVHPLHVESVAWVAERKDVLCAFFFLLSLLSYARHLEILASRGEGHQPGRFLGGRHLSFAFFFFLLALMSKPMAVSLPLILLILDWWPGSRFRGKREVVSCLVEKIPFIAGSLLSSVVTILAQGSGNAVVPLELMPLPSRFLVGIQSLVLYVWKTFVPVHLIPLYPYPPQSEISILSAGYLASLLAVVCISVVAYVLAKRNGKTLAAVWLCHCVPLLPVIGIVQVGGQAMADRYAYLPSAGWCLLAGYGVAWTGRRLFPVKSGVIAGQVLTAVMAAGLAYGTIGQIKVWESGLSLWDYVITRQKGNIAAAYYNRGLIHGENRNLDGAIADFTEVIRLNASFDMAYNNRGTAYFMKQDLTSALADYNAAIALNAGNAESYVNRGMLLLNLRNGKAGIDDLRKGCALGNATGCELLRKVN